MMEHVGGVAVSVAGMLQLSMGCILLGLTDPTAGLAQPQSSGPPAPLGIPVGSPAMWAVSYAAMILVNTGYALVWTPILPLMMDLAKVELADGSRDAANAVSAIFNAAAAMGEAAGPIIGGAMSSVHGFAGTSLTPALASLLYAAALFSRAPHLGGFSRRPSADDSLDALEHAVAAPSQIHLRSSIAGPAHEMSRSISGGSANEVSPAHFAPIRL